MKRSLVWHSDTKDSREFVFPKPTLKVLKRFTMYLNQFANDFYRKDMCEVRS